MPVMDGFELAELIDKMYKGKKRPRIIGITAQLILDDELDKSKEYFDDFVYKPINYQELSSKICI
jgi:CheY-like chemotaxis protein